VHDLRECFGQLDAQAVDEVVFGVSASLEKLL
jgi:hypothetical protein